MRNIWASKLLGITVLALGTVHCSSSDDGGGTGGGGGSGATGSQCADISGTWSVTGTCPNLSNCTIAQSGCTANLACDFGSTTATVSGNSLSFGVQGTPCTGTISNQQITTSCTTSSGTCNATATCTSGACAASSGGTGGGGGSGGGSGGGAGDPLQQKCSQMCDVFLAAPLNSCGKDFSSNPEKCDSECYAHVTPQGGLPPEATEAQLDCAIAAPDCDAWTACGGDLL